MKIRGIIALILAVVMVAATLAGCGETSGSEDSDEPAVAESLDGAVSEPIEIAALNGPTGMGLAPLIGDERFNITIYQSPDEITGKVISGEVDIAAVPSNLAAVLYNKTDGGVKIVSTITMGVLYIVEDGEAITDFSQLDGKTIYGSGQGAVPEYVMNFLASTYGITIDMQWLGTHADVAAKLKSDADAAVAAGKESSGTIVLLPEPQVSIVEASASGNQYNILDINAVWDERTGEELPMGVLIAQTDFLMNRNADFDIFMKNAMDSVGRVQSAQWDISSDDEAVKMSAQEVVDALVSNGFFKSDAAALAAIPNCNIVLYYGDDSYQTGLDALYNLLYSNNPKSVGGKLPDSQIYQ